jgi:uncharacterized membrane protein YczE
LRIEAIGASTFDMTAAELLIHLLNFVAPALFIALVLSLLPRIFRRTKRAGAPAWWVQATIVFIAGVVVLAAGLAWFGHDGQIATYAALVVVCGTAQWLVGRGFSR